MRDRPNGAELLAEAWRVLSHDLAPGLSGEQRYQVLLVAAAVGMVRRELDAGEAPAEAERAALTDLLQRSGDLAALNADLAAAIREGRYDAAPAVYDLLLQSCVARVKESNPKALDLPG
ncbi:DUF6285 domain-containing protein [Algihabitans albus]|uniref:DUF6285 domain-containing protein n=1 Tax=Algihabitans albus TaxID=2164067 RepID=UPI0035CF8613